MTWGSPRISVVAFSPLGDFSDRLSGGPAGQRLEDARHLRETHEAEDPPLCFRNRNQHPPVGFRDIVGDVVE